MIVALEFQRAINYAEEARQYGKMYSVARWVALININSFNTISLELETYREGYGSQNKEPPSSESHTYIRLQFYCNYILILIIQLQCMLQLQSMLVDIQQPAINYYCTVDCMYVANHRLSSFACGTSFFPQFIGHSAWSLHVQRRLIILFKCVISVNLNAINQL